MKHNRIIFVFLTSIAILLFFPIESSAKRGCCSWHGGVARCDSNVGRLVCHDGSYSPSCICAVSPSKAVKHSIPTADKFVEESTKTKEALGEFKKAFHKAKHINGNQDFQEVVNLLNESIKNDCPFAYFTLATLYLDKFTAGSQFYNTKGVPNDLIIAINNYKKAFEFGSSSAANILGEIYLHYANLNEENRRIQEGLYEVKDEDLPINLPDINKAVYWHTKAATMGNPAAQGTLSDLYRQGIGVPQDYVFAYVWQNLATASQLRFNKARQNQMGVYMSQGEKEWRDSLYNSLTQEQKNEAQKISKEYAEKYFIEPDSFERICQSIQTAIARMNIEKLIEQQKKLLKNMKNQ